MTTNLALNNSIDVINAKLTTASNILYNCSVLLYQKIPQKSVTYAPFDNAVVNYQYVPANLQFSLYFGLNQIQTIITYYVNNVNAVLADIVASGFEAQLSNKINTLNQSISQLNNYAIALYQGQQTKIKNYVTPTPMSIRSALLLNNFSLNNLDIVILYNINSIYSLNYIPAGTELILL